MKILLDHNVPRHLVRLAPEQSIDCAADLGWSKLSNGLLLQQAERAGYQVLMTLDRGFEHQQKMQGRNICLALLKTKNSNSRKHLIPIFLRALAEVGVMRPGKLYIFEETGEP